jgi:hypothetical protein
MILKGVINVLSVGHSSAPTEAAAAAQKHITRTTNGLNRDRKNDVQHRALRIVLQSYPLFLNLEEMKK